MDTVQVIDRLARDSDPEANPVLADPTTSTAMAIRPDDVYERDRARAGAEPRAMPGSVGLVGIEPTAHRL